MTKMILITALSILLLGLLIFSPREFAAADNTDGVPALITAIESGEVEMLLADAPKGTGDSGVNLSEIYTELKDLTKKYRKAKDRDAKERIHVRAQELMSQLFDAKVRMDGARIKAAEERIASEKRRLADMQSHKQDLVHQGVQKALNEGQLPEWAPREREMSE